LSELTLGSVSADGNFYWDGVQWVSSLSPDGRWRWSGQAWVPIATGAWPTTLAGQQLESGLHFLRSERHVALLLLVANFPYLVWWLWHLFKLAQRERFPRARSFWWNLVPIYGFVVVWRTVDDLVDKERELTGRATTSAKVTWWYIISSAYGGSGDFPGGLDAAIFVINAAVAAIFGFKIQTSANNYLRAKYPGSMTRGWTPGEVLATVLGILLLALAISQALLPSS
jgi:hypothetical protein